MNSKSLACRHRKQQHYMDKSDKHKLTKPESSVVSSCGKSLVEKANTKASMEHEKCELIDDDQPDSDHQKRREILVTILLVIIRISYTKVLYCVM